MKTIAMILLAAATAAAQDSSVPARPLPPKPAAQGRSVPTRPSTPAAKGRSVPARQVPPTPAAQSRPVRARQVSPKSAATSPDTTSAIPKGAIEVEPDLYRYTDAHGKTWLARRTPFGYSRWEDKPEPAQPVQVDTAPPVKATDLGDSVRFERQTPFGKNIWVRKKTDLTDEEKGWLSAAQPRKTAAKPVEAPANTAEKR